MLSSELICSAACQVLVLTPVLERLARLKWCALLAALLITSISNKGVFPFCVDEFGIAVMFPIWYSRGHERLVLCGKAGEVGCSANMTFGSRVMRRILGEEAHHFELNHFVLDPERKLGWSIWRVEECDGVLNPLFINGVLLGPKSRPLANGDVLSLRDGIGAVTIRLGGG